MNLEPTTNCNINYILILILKMLCCCNKSHCLSASSMMTVMQMVTHGVMLGGNLHRTTFAQAVVLCMRGDNTRRRGLASK
jgi:hypothetical protein